MLFFCLSTIALSKFPRVELSNEEKAGPLETHLRLFKKPVVNLFFVAMICYVGTEQGIANWMSQFLSTYHHYDPQTKGAQDVAYFWGLMTAGGVVGLLLLKIIHAWFLWMISTDVRLENRVIQLLQLKEESK